jgi:hypothetical protein
MPSLLLKAATESCRAELPCPPEDGTPEGAAGPLHARDVYAFAKLVEMLAESIPAGATDEGLSDFSDRVSQQVLDGQGGCAFAFVQNERGSGCVSSVCAMFVGVQDRPCPNSLIQQQCHRLCVLTFRERPLLPLPLLHPHYNGHAQTRTRGRPCRSC